MGRRLALGAVVAAAIAASAGVASASSVTFTGDYADLSGTGNGTVLGVLSMDQNGNNTYEWGTSGWNGTQVTWSTSSSQVHMDTSSSGYYARSVGDLAAAGINKSNFAVVFQVNVSGQKYPDDSLDVSHFFVDFYGADGSLLSSLEYTPDNHDVTGTDIYNQVGATKDDGVLPGVGQGSSGWLYNVDLSSVPAGFFNNENNHIGMHVVGEDTSKNTGSADINNANDGADNFFFAPTAVAVPVPASVWSGLSLLALLGVGAGLRKKFAH